MNPDRAPCKGTDCFYAGMTMGWIHYASDATCSVKNVTNIQQLPSMEDCVKFMLLHMGEDPRREGLRETPARVAKAWREWVRGPKRDTYDIFKHFKDGAADYDEMVILKDAPFYSHCEHHLAPFFGTATVAYIPNGRVLGLSKLSRLVDRYARRLQVQERLTTEIAHELASNTDLNPKGVGVLIKARHMCMESRGIRQQGHYTVTSALRGVFLTKPEARAEFLQLAGAGK